jgi:hypothetical protein
MLINKQLQETSIGSDPSKKSGFIGYPFAKKFVSDPRIAFLSIEAIGLLMMLQARTVAGFPTPSKASSACRVLGIPTKSWVKGIGDLLSCNPPLASEENGFFIAQSVGHIVDPELSSRRSAAASARWASRSEAEGASVAKLEKKEKKKTLIKIADSVFSDGVKKNILGVLAVDSSIQKEHTESKSMDSSLSLSLFPHQDNLIVPKKVKPAPCPFEDLAALFLSICSDLPRIQPVKNWPINRCNRLQQLWKTHPDMQFWKEFFETVQDSDFLCRRGKNEIWNADFDWLIKPANFAKVVEGNYSINSKSRTSLFNAGDNQKPEKYSESVISSDNVFMQIAEKMSKTQDEKPS